MTINRTIFNKNGVTQISEEDDDMPTAEELTAQAEVALVQTADLNRTTRNYLLSISDWTQNADSPLTDAKKTEWATYREALRNLPATNTDWPNIADDDWPTKPT
tara:strand:+ start:2955 stop:3266 length:312 start_codon:yes stop_codon:yes gene_type:complete